MVVSTCPKCVISIIVDKTSFSIFRLFNQKSHFNRKTFFFMGYGNNGHQIRIPRIEKIRMGNFSAHINYTKPSKHNLMYFPIALSSPLRVKPAQSQIDKKDTNRSSTPHGIVAWSIVFDS